MGRKLFKTATWACTAGAVVIGVAWVGSAFGRAWWRVPGPMSSRDTVLCIQLGGGRVTFLLDTYVGPTDAAQSLAAHGGLHGEWGASGFQWRFSWDRTQNPTCGAIWETQSVDIPLWPGPLLFGGPALWMAIKWRGCSLGLCPSCGYSLAGLAKGSTCPECGREGAHGGYQ